MSIQSIQSILSRMEQIDRKLEQVLGDDKADAFAQVMAQLAETPASPSPQMPGDDIMGIIESQAAKHGIDANLVKAVVQTESNFNPLAVSKAGAQGLMQLMPGTAEDLGVDNALNATDNVDGGVRYLKSMLGKYGGSLDKALAAYNAGPGNVDKYGGIPPFKETQGYVSKVINAYQKFSG